MKQLHSELNEIERKLCRTSPNVTLRRFGSNHPTLNSYRCPLMLSHPRAQPARRKNGWRVCRDHLMLQRLWAARVHFEVKLTPTGGLRPSLERHVSNTAAMS